MTEKLLLATDLDRTVLPNGEQEELPDARQRFHTLTEREEVCLVYISGRSEDLLKEAITEFDIPVPAYAIGDVGTSIFITHDSSWKPLQQWQEVIALDWQGKSHADLSALFSDVSTLTLQEKSKQNTFKLSYYAPEDTDRDALIAQMQSILDDASINASLIWSIDEEEHRGLMDVLPERATKLHALEFLQKFLGFDDSQTIFCGDSGNDMPALIHAPHAVLVANARDDVKKEAASSARNLYIAHENYSAGVLEGVAHFFPKIVDTV